MEKNNGLSKHVDTIVVLSAIFGSFLWMNHKFNDIETRLTKIETVLILQKIMPQDLCIEGKKQ